MNLFNALNGKETKTAILNEISRALDNDSEFREHLTFPRVHWSWRLEMHIYPRTPEEKIIDVQGEIIEVAKDTNGQLFPTTSEKDSHVKEVLHANREAQAPDAVREAEGISVSQAAPGGIKFAKKVETGKAAENPVYSPQLNR